jgi:hypothetical protein
VEFKEIFTGSNYKSYKHKYFLTYVKNSSSINMNNYEKTEVSCLEWKTYDQCIQCVRPYNLEKISLMTKINNTLNTFQIACAV